MAKYTVIETRKVTSLDPTNATGTDTLVTFVDEAHRRDVVTVSGADPSADDIKAAIEQHVGARDKHLGATFEIS